LGHPGLADLVTKSPSTILASLRLLLQTAKQTVQDVSRPETPLTWEAVIVPMDEQHRQLEQGWGRVRHLASVVSTAERERLVEQGSALLSAYTSWYGQYQPLYKKVKAIVKTSKNLKLSPAQRRALELQQRELVLLGAELDTQKRKKLSQLRQQLSTLSNAFSRNYVTAAAKTTLHIRDKNKLRGIPPALEQQALDRAVQNKKNGWIFLVQSPEYQQLMRTAEDRSFRRQLLQLRNTLASDLGPRAQDNSRIMRDTIRLRQSVAQVLGFSHFADLSTSTKMAGRVAQAQELLLQLAPPAKAQAKKEWQDLVSYGRKHRLSIPQPWDDEWLLEKYQQEHAGHNQESVRQYFPITAVWSAFVTTVTRVTGLKLDVIKNFPVYHPSVQAYRISDAKGRDRGTLLIDLYARPHKRSGAWVGGDICRGFSRGVFQPSVVHLVCNFPAAQKLSAAFLDYQGVVTLFHEGGHAIHHFLSEVDEYGVAELNGVEWDAVEIPSQWFERYAGDEKTWDLIGSYSGQPIPSQVRTYLRQQKTWIGGRRLVRQIQFGLFDLQIHTLPQPSIMNEWRRVTRAYPYPPTIHSNRFPHGFSHIFSGGYAAGYYSYLWSEVYAADIYRRAKDSSFRRAFLSTVLARGGERPASEVYRDLIGPRPALQALLAEYGISGRKRRLDG